MGRFCYWTSRENAGFEVSPVPVVRGVRYQSGIRLFEQHQRSYSSCSIVESKLHPVLYKGNLCADVVIVLLLLHFAICSYFRKTSLLRRCLKAGVVMVGQSQASCFPVYAYLGELSTDHSVTLHTDRESYWSSHLPGGKLVRTCHHKNYFSSHFFLLGHPSLLKDGVPGLTSTRLFLLIQPE